VPHAVAFRHGRRDRFRRAFPRHPESAMKTVLMLKVARAALPLAFVGATVGCASSEPAASRTVTVVERTVAAAPATPEPATVDARSVRRSAPPTADAATSGKITVPNVVGEDHQFAQDKMQAAGLYNLSEEDATGQDRLLLIDRNWKVVTQAPTPGSKVSEDTTITLGSKKLTDP
jgi:hypothetical protein